MPLQNPSEVYRVGKRPRRHDAVHQDQLIGFNESEINRIVVENSRLNRKLGLSPNVFRELREPKTSARLTKPAEDGPTTDQ